MTNLCELFGVVEREKFSIALKGEWVAPQSPYYVQGNALFDRMDRLADDMLGKIMRGKAEVVRSKYHLLSQHRERYFYFDDEMRVQSRVNKGALVDIINALIGNMFVSKNELCSMKMLSIKQKKATLMGPESFETVRSTIDRISEQNKSEVLSDELSGVLSTLFQKHIAE